MKKTAALLIAALLTTFSAAAVQGGPQPEDGDFLVTNKMPSAGPEDTTPRPEDQRPDTRKKPSEIGPGTLPDQASQVAKDVTSAITETLGSGAENIGKTLSNILQGITPGQETRETNSTQ